MHTQTKFRLLVVRLGAMGDILHALPAVTALRRAHPCWVIDWVVEPRWRALLAAGEPAAKQNIAPCDDQPIPSGQRQFRPDPAHPVIDGLHFAATKAWRKAPFSSQTFHEIRALRQSLRLGDYDTVLDLQGALRSAAVARMAACQRVIGEEQPRERAARWLYTERVETAAAHVIEQDVELAAAVAGDELKPEAPLLPVDTAAEAWADGVLPGESGPAVLVNPGAGWGAKRWPTERYAAVARGLIERGMKVLVNAGPGEEALAEQILADAAGAAVVVCTLPQLIALTRRVALAVAGDTGPLHLACALGRPVVGIYGPTDPARNGPYGTRFRVLRSPESVRNHTRHAAPEAGLLTIEPEAVLQAAEELLNEGNAR